MSAEEANREYREEAGRWKLPQGAEWPAEDPMKEKASDDAEIRYGVQFGRIEATKYWSCQWMQAVLAAATPKERSEALRELDKLKNAPFYIDGLDSTRTIDEVLDAARSGNDGPLTKYLRVNCSNPKRETSL